VTQYETEKAGGQILKSLQWHITTRFLKMPYLNVMFLQTNLYTKEEMKLVNETKKILGDDTLRITATAVRIPVNGGHSESVNVEFHCSPFELKDVKNILETADGITVLDDPENFNYPMPLYCKK
jgi:aspartate-semialdehyde dehydrogenase